MGEIVGVGGRKPNPVLCEAIRNKSKKCNFKIWNYNKNNFDYLINASPAEINNEYPVHQNIIKNSKVVVD